MTEIHQDIKLQKKKKASFLPPMNPEESHSRAGSNTSLNKHTVQVSEATLDRLRVMLREREIEVGKLRSENSTLRQRDRRNQKDIENLEQQNQEAPKLIMRLREELVIAKNKLKQYYTQVGEDSRIIRQLHDEKNKYKEQNQKLQQLVDAQHLEERDELTKEIEQQSKKISELQKLVQESEKNLEMVERNLACDNRQLRAKIHSLEQEKVLIKEQIVKLQTTVREKDKFIASLSIYRYNAIHRKQEQQCKVCAKREKDEYEQKKRQEIYSKLPPLEIKEIQLLSSTSAILTIGCDEIEKYEYSSVTVSYSDDPTMAERVEKETFDKTSLENGITLHNLKSGCVYYFHVVPVHEKVMGSPSKAASILVDALPESPKISSARAKLSPPAIQVLFSPPINNGSVITSYRLYHSQTADFKESYLAFDEVVDQLQQRGDFLVFTITEPLLAVPYYFKVSACNAMGEGPMSDISTETIVDMPPPRPEKPVIKRISSSSLKISVTNPQPLGSPPTRFKIKMCHIVELEGDENHEEVEEILVEQIVSIRNYEFHHVIDSVERGTTYKFAVRACNSQGESEQSEWSDEVDIDLMVPACGDLNLISFTAESITIKSVPKPNVEKPAIKGYMIKWSNTHKMSTIVGSSDLLQCGKGNYTIPGLDVGKPYYVTATYIGEFEEGEPSKPLFVLPAATIPLPPSPLPTDERRESVTQSVPEDLNATPPVHPLRKLSSLGSSSLSINQRVANMHYGMPAYHDPPADSPSITQHHSSTDNLALPTEKRKQKAKQGQPRRSDVRIGNHRGSNSSLNRSGSLPQLRDSTRK